MNDLREKLIALSLKCRNMDAETNRLIDECIRDVEGMKNNLTSHVKFDAMEIMDEDYIFTASIPVSVSKVVSREDGEMDTLFNGKTNIYDSKLVQKHLKDKLADSLIRTLLHLRKVEGNDGAK